MRAVVYEDVGKVKVQDVPDPAIEEVGDAVVRVTKAAICGSDLHFYHGKAPLLPGEQIGHEGVGVVEEVGEGVTKHQPGDRVVISFNAVCGECWFCTHEQHSLCGDFRTWGPGCPAAPRGAQAEPRPGSRAPT